MSAHEKEHETKVNAKRPLVVADVLSFEGTAFLVAFLYESTYTIAQIVTPIAKINEEGSTLSDALIEIVRVNFNLADPIAFDLYTSSDILITETIGSPYILGQLKDKSETSECQRCIDDPNLQEALRDLDIEPYRRKYKADRKGRSLFRKVGEWIGRTVKRIIRKLAV
ncbi:hypothetical protein MKX99_24965 [Bacillus sp. FSL R9-9863]|uniref:hypothetical protein n=1 Tax=Bacillus sp. FSL R9-9863 TaxID=2921693 RepID=UPI0030F4C060|nr:hypothetical protein [Bacillus cereus]